MNNVIAFPEPKRCQPRRRTPAGHGSKTLFIHVRRATFIAHFAGKRHETVKTDPRFGRS